MENQDMIESIKSGKIFIYPTDTIYGIGCDATNKQAVEKIRQIKNRDNKPFSVIAPSFDWIYENCIVDCDLKKYFPGQYTLLLKKKNLDFLKWVSDNDRIGIRIPNHDFIENIKEADAPFIITSVNFSGENFATCMEEVNKEILNKVDIIIDSGKLDGCSSTLILDGKEIKRN